MGVVRYALVNEKRRFWATVVGTSGAKGKTGTWVFMAIGALQGEQRTSCTTLSALGGLRSDTSLNLRTTRLQEPRFRPRDVEDSGALETHARPA